MQIKNREYKITSSSNVESFMDPQIQSKFGGQRYLQYPGHLLEPFLNHIKGGDRPESFPGLCLDRIPRETPYHIISQFHFDTKKKDRHVDCAMCTPNRFSKGWFIWVQSLERVFIIGHECAKQENQAQAQNSYIYEQTTRSWENALEADLPKLVVIKKAWSRNIEIARKAQQAARSFKRKFKSSYERLGAQRRQDSKLLVVNALRSEQAGSLQATETQDFGNLEGSDFLKTTFKPAGRLELLNEALEALPDPQGDADKAFELITEMPRDELHWIVSRIFQISDANTKSLQEVSSAYQFFGQQNFERINRWIKAHEDKRLSEFSWEKNEGNIRLTGREAGDFQLMNIPHSGLAKWSQIPALECSKIKKLINLG